LEVLTTVTADARSQHHAAATRNSQLENSLRHATKELETAQQNCTNALQEVGVCCSVLQRVAMSCSMLQCVAVCCCVLLAAIDGAAAVHQRAPGDSCMLQCAAACCNVLQRAAMCCSVL